MAKLPPPDVLESLLPYATRKQAEIIKLRLKGLTWKQVQDKTGVDRGNAAQYLVRLQSRAARAGWQGASGLGPYPDGVQFGGATIHRIYDAETGDWRVHQAWDKPKPGSVTPEQLAKFLEDNLEAYAGAGGKVASPRKVHRNCFSVFPMGDPHVGLYAWHRESGSDFDADICQRNLTSAMSQLVETGPATDLAVVLNLGDFFHSDDSSNQTKRANNPLDVDSRWSRVFDIGFQAMIQIVDLARAKHRRVVVKNLIGNHDEHTSQALAIALAAYFRNDKRVEVDTSPARFWYYRRGKVLIGAAHGDTAKPDLLPNIMAADRPEDWGNSSFRYWYTGHIHSQNMKEYAGVIWESFKTLAAKDAWHAAQGYRSGRDMYCIVHHEDYGEVERHRVDISML